MKNKLLLTSIFAFIVFNLKAQHIAPLDTHIISTTKSSMIKHSNPPVIIDPKKIVDNGLISEPIEDEDGRNKNEENEKYLHEIFLKKLSDTTKGVEKDGNIKSLTPPQTLLSPPSIISSFIAQQTVPTSTGGCPPDNSIAISNGGNIISADNLHINFYTTTGSLVYSWTYPSFFGTTNTSWADPRVIYDSGADRFILFIQSGSTPSTSFIEICYSSTNNPLDPWYAFTYNTEFTSGGNWFDYPNIAVSNSELFVSGNLIKTLNPGNIMYQFDKYQGYSGVSPNYVYYMNISEGTWDAYTVVPIPWGQQGNYGPNIYFVETEHRSITGTHDNVYLFQVTNTLYNSPAINKIADISVPAFTESAPATQMGSSSGLDNGYTNIKNGFYLNGIIHFVYIADVNGRSGIFYNQLNVSSSTILTAITSNTASDYSYPSVASLGTSINDNSVVISFMKSDNATFPEMRYKYYDNTMTPVTSVQIQPGQGPMDFCWDNNKNAQRWGDYTTIQRRFNTSTYPTVWCAGSFVEVFSPNNIWTTSVAEIGYQNPSGVNENIFGDNFSIYPNPNDGNFTLITDEQNQKIRISISNIFGSKIFESKTSTLKTEIDLSNQSNGIYFFQINSEKGSLTKKIIINK